MNGSGPRGVCRALHGHAAAAALLGLCVCAGSCAAPLMKLPAGPGAPVTDVADVFAQATAACRTIRTLTAEVGIGGSAGGRRLRGRLSTGVLAPASVRFEFVAPFGPPIFTFVAIGTDATLLLPRDDRVLEHGNPAVVLNAVAGVPLETADLVALLTGCVPAGSTFDGRELEPDWRVMHVSTATVTYDVYLHREGESPRWRAVALLRHGPTDQTIRIEYRDFQNDQPRAIHLVSKSGVKESDFDLTLALSQVETNVPLGPDVFRVAIPASAAPITSDELRRARLGLREN
jgi:hypothetical protein